MNIERSIWNKRKQRSLEKRLINYFNIEPAPQEPDTQMEDSIGSIG